MGNNKINKNTNPTVEQPEIKVHIEKIEMHNSSARKIVIVPQPKTLIRKQSIHFEQWIDQHLSNKIELLLHSFVVINLDVLYKISVIICRVLFPMCLYSSHTKMLVLYTYSHTKMLGLYTEIIQFLFTVEQKNKSSE